MPLEQYCEALIRARPDVPALPRRAAFPE
jgi:hypothetical protein